MLSAALSIKVRPSGVSQFLKAPTVVSILILLLLAWFFPQLSKNQSTDNRNPQAIWEQKVAYTSTDKEF